MIKSEIIADSLNCVGNRLTSFILEYPRYIHSEVMTHRAFSKNAASSRAIPIEKMIQQIQENPAMPTHWGKNQSGMQANEELTGAELDCVKDTWLQARNAAIKSVKRLNELGLHKQIANRLLEPWFHIRIILSGTEFENFFALRAHKDAHPDLQKLAYLMLDQYNASNPSKLNHGEWHIPFGDRIDEKAISTLIDKLYTVQPGSAVQEIRRKIAVARCARISYWNYEGNDDYEADFKLCDRLFGSTPKHLSPTEHVAMALATSQRLGNFKGFMQYRKLFKEENLSDQRVIKKTQ